jgi:hypothetical protein
VLVLVLVAPPAPVTLVLVLVLVAPPAPVVPPPGLLPPSPEIAASVARLSPDELQAMPMRPRTIAIAVRLDNFPWVQVIDAPWVESCSAVRFGNITTLQL